MGDYVPAGDLLCEVAQRFADLEGSTGARAALAEVLAATLQAFTQTASVRDPVPVTAPRSAEESLAVLGGIDHLRSSLAALEAVWQVRAAQRIHEEDKRRDIAAVDQGKGTAHEIGLAGRVSPASAAFSLASARRLTQQMPGVFSQLWEGRIPTRQAATMASSLAGAEPETCAAIDQLICEDLQSLEGKGDRELRSDLQRLIQRIEPGRSRDRAERAARARHVTMSPLADGMARVSAVLRGVDAAGLMKTLQRRAESLRAAGTRDPVSALEADLFVGAVLDSSEQPPGKGERTHRSSALDLGIVITDTALLGREDEAECALLEGYGTIPAHIITDTLRGTPPGYLRSTEDHPDRAEDHPDQTVSAFYRRLYASPSTGELIAMESRARAFPAGLARMIRWRDVTCRAPWCNAIIRQIDHVEPHHRGGLTSYTNGQGLCARCNQVKELGLWTLASWAPEPVPADEEYTEGTESTESTESTEDCIATAPPASGWSWRSPHGAQGRSATPRLIDLRGGPAESPPEGTPPTDPEPPAPDSGSGPSTPPGSPSAPVSAFHRGGAGVTVAVDQDPGCWGGRARRRDRSRRRRPPHRAPRRTIRIPLHRDVAGDVRLRATCAGQAWGAGRGAKGLGRTASGSDPRPGRSYSRDAPRRGRAPPRMLGSCADPPGSRADPAGGGAGCPRAVQHRRACRAAWTPRRAGRLRVSSASGRGW